MMKMIHKRVQFKNTGVFWLHLCDDCVRHDGNTNYKLLSELWVYNEDGTLSLEAELCSRVERFRGLFAIVDSDGDVCRAGKVIGRESDLVEI